MNAALKTCVILPTKNEEESIAYMIEEIKKLNLPILVIDEHSKDRTEEIARGKGIEVFQRTGSGKGRGVISALEIAHQQGYDLVVLIDCDGTYHPRYIPQLLSFFPQHDMVIGKRSMGDVKFLHRLPNILHTQAINFLFGGKLHDINSGLRAFKVEKMLGVLTAAGFDIEAQMTIQALKQNLAITEIGIDYTKRLGSSKIRLKDGYLILKRIIMERF